MEKVLKMIKYKKVWTNRDGDVLKVFYCLNKFIFVFQNELIFIIICIIYFLISMQVLVPMSARN